MKLLLIGNGKWGQKYVSTISNIPNISLDIANRFNWKDKISEHPDGVLICTPPQSHIEIADYSMSRQIPTMIEKPLSLSLEDAEQLKKYDVPILINHIHLFSDTYQNIKKIVKNKEITLIWSLGLGDNPPRNYSALWDYGPHDFSLILDLLQEIPQNISISKHNWLDQFSVKLTFNKCISESTFGCQPLAKTRLLQVEFDGMYVGYEDTRRPPDHSPPLLNAIQVFIKSITGKSDDRLGLDLSLKVIKLLEQCNKML